MNIAILIDAENIDPAYAEQIFSYAGSKGTVVTREIYGAGIALNEWSGAILQYVLHTNMTLKPSRFKNSTDIALVIGAMDLLVEKAARGKTGEQNTTADAVLIASSDSDYSALAHHLRASGIEVIGMGIDGRINPSWPMACSEFIAFTPVDETSQESEKRTIYPQQKADNQAATHVTTHNVDRGQVHRRHIDRVTSIRAFISEQLSKNDGQMPSASLFNLLKDQPDYLYDQQRSKCSPLTYLKKQYGDLLEIQKNSDGALWIYSKLVAAVTETDDKSTAPQEDAPQQKELQQEVPQDTESATFPLIEFLCDAGVDETAALKVSSAYVKCSNMRDVYNILRKTFKTEPGNAYYKLVKQYKESQNKKTDE